MTRALVLGYGESGKAAEEFLRRCRYELVIADQKAEGSIRADTDLSALDGVEKVIVSPGVAPTQLLYATARARGIPIIGEVELAFQHLKHRAVGVTGTNGKTTVTLMVTHVLNQCGLPAVAVGNVGVPLIRAIEREPLETILVVELSSWQLETVSTPALEAALINNITPNHLDRHVNMDDYVKAKAKIQNALRPNGTLYLYKEIVKQFGNHFPRATEETDCFYRTERGVLKKCSLPDLSTAASTTFAENMMAAYLLCSTYGVSEADFVRAVATFQKPPHRMQSVRQCRGVNYVDDSKGTNIDAVVKAVETIPGGIHLIAGGLDKGTGYQLWVEQFPGRVKSVFAIGEAAAAIRAALQPILPVHLVATLEEAVQQASAVAEKGDTVLLSPGCASYDMFKNYQHRGMVYQELVHQLCEQKEGLL